MSLSKLISSGAPEASQLQELVRSRISSLHPDVDGDLASQFLLTLIGNDREPEMILTEMNDFFDGKFDPEFLAWVFSEGEKLTGPGDISENPRENSTLKDPSSDEVSGMDIDAPRGPRATQTSFKRHPTFAEPPRMPRNFNPQTGRNRGRQAGYGVNKGGSSMRLGGHSVGNNISRAGLIERNFREERDNRDDSASISLIPQDRCRNWPTCTYPNCRFAHPSEICAEYPNCPRPPGTCPKLHVGQDVPFEWAAALAGGDGHSIKRASATAADAARVAVEFSMASSLFRPKVPNSFVTPDMVLASKIAASLPPITLCKFSDRCANASCLFGHPTPAGSKSKVTVLEWCEAKENCTDSSCPRAHPSGSLVRAPEPIPEKILETCRFLDRCTNPKCRYRHPLSAIVCRNGSDCDRIDCFFTHPFKEMCKFSINCRNPDCLYQHPKERNEALNAGVTMTWTNKRNTSDRRFAVAQDEVMENLVQDAIPEAELRDDGRPLTSGITESA